MMRSLALGLTAGRYWQYKCLLAAVLCTFTFTTAPSVLTQRGLTLPPAYDLKASRPLADTAPLTVPEHEGERSHGAKLTPRLLGSSLLHLSTLLGLHPYTFSTLFGLALLYSGLLAGYALSGDRWTALFTSLIFAGLYASAACFSVNWMPKPFDGIAIGMVGLTAAAFGRVYLLGFLAYLGLWADERALLGMLLIGAVIYLLPQMERRAKRDRLLALVVAVIAYAITRIGLAYALGWTAPDMGMIGMSAGSSVAYLPLAAWMCFEGGWLLVIAAVALLYAQGQPQPALILLVAAGTAAAACVLVLDVSRVSSFTFPVILAALAGLARTDLALRHLRTYAGAAALVSLLAPSLEVIAGVTVKWLPSLLSVLAAR